MAAWARTCVLKPNMAKKSAFFSAFTDGEEAEFVAEEIKALHRDGMDLAQTAVLYRSNAQSRVLEQTLFRAGLPCVPTAACAFMSGRRSNTHLLICGWRLIPTTITPCCASSMCPHAVLAAALVEKHSGCCFAGIPLRQAACHVAVKNGKVATLCA